MAGTRIIFPQFRDEQEDSRYPFVDKATLLSTENALEVGRDTFIDAAIYAIGGFARAYISAVTVSASEIVITVGDQNNKTRATARWMPASPPENGVLDLLDSYGRPAGMLLSAPLRLARFAAWPARTHTFALAATEFVNTCVIPAREPGVRGLIAADGTLLTGDVWLIGDRGVVVRQDGEGVIRIDIIGSPLFLRELCDNLNKFTPKTYIKTINGCTPDEYGNFTLTATGHNASDTVLRIYPSDGNLKIDVIGKKVV
jgi:hypothetical protein